MSTLDLTKESKRKPAEVVSDVALSEEAVALMPEAPNTLAYLESLYAQGLFEDAFLALARVLPRQYAIMWACRCVEQFAGAPPRPEDQRCLDLSKRWIAGPDERVRRATMEAADAGGYDGPWAWLAASVGFSGGSIAPVNQAEIQPPKQVSAVAVSACLIGIMVKNPDPESMAEISRKMIDSGLSMVAIPSGSEEGRQ